MVHRRTNQCTDNKLFTEGQINAWMDKLFTERQTNAQIINCSPKDKSMHGWINCPQKDKPEDQWSYKCSPEIWDMQPKIGQGHPGVMIYTNFVELHSLCLRQSFKIIGLLVLKNKIYKGFCYL